MYFEGSGPANTDRCLETAFNEAKKRGIKHIVLASTWGDTAKKAADMIKNSGINLVVVTHNSGFKQPGIQEFDEELRRQLTEQGVKIHTGSMVTRNLGRAIKDKTGFSQEDICCFSWKMFGQGTKVCIEITAMACDAGLIPPEDVIAVAGSGKGADTALLINAASSNNMFDMKIREILAKPFDW